MANFAVLFCLKCLPITHIPERYSEYINLIDSYTVLSAHDALLSKSDNTLNVFFKK